MEIKQWIWMMDWCKKNKLHPGENYVWEMAKTEYYKTEKEKQNDSKEN